MAYILFVLIDSTLQTRGTRACLGTVLLRTTTGGAKFLSRYSTVIRHSVTKNHYRRGEIPVEVLDRD